MHGEIRIEDYRADPQCTAQLMSFATTPGGPPRCIVAREEKKKKTKGSTGPGHTKPVVEVLVDWCVEFAKSAAKEGRIA